MSTGVPCPPMESLMSVTDKAATPEAKPLKNKFYEAELARLQDLGD